jgi:hypothetical protein
VKITPIPRPALSALAFATLILSMGRSSADTYSQDFTTDPGGSVQSAVVTGGFLRLTTNTNDNVGAFHIPAIPDSSKGFTATFDITIIDNTGNNPADGFSFSYGAIPPGTISAQSEEGWPGITPVISYEIDTWENGSAEVGVNVAVNNVDLPGGFINGNILNDDTTVTGTATLSWYPGVGASFTTTGLVTNANFVNLPTTFAGDDAFTFAFAARTGGANEEVQIDNLVITTGAPDTDGDGLPDAWETANMFDPNDNGLNPNNVGAVGDPVNGAMGNPDTDELTNLEELDNGTNPRVADTDMDNLLDGPEVKGTAGMRPATNPLNPDTDSDGLNDDVESNSGTFVSAMDPGTDPTDPDTDGDLSPDRREILKGTNPLDSGQKPPLSPVGTYMQDFDGFPNGYSGILLDDGSDIESSDGIATVQGDQFRLTKDEVGGTRSSYRIPALPGSSQGWTATFDLTLSDSVGSNPPADGFSFCWGAIPTFNPAQPDVVAPDSHGQAEEGWGAVEHISFEIDTWQPGDAEHGYNIAGYIGGVQQDFMFLNQDIITDGQSVTTAVTLSWNPVDGASMESTATGPIFTNVAIPNFTGDDAFVFAFGGRTGGAHETVLIDNLMIQSGTASVPPFVITNFNYNQGADTVTLTWNSRPGYTYAIDSSDDFQEDTQLVLPAWEEIADGIPSAGTTTTSGPLGVAPGTQELYFRVRVQSTP